MWKVKFYTYYFKLQTSNERGLSLNAAALFYVNRPPKLYK